MRYDVDGDGSIEFDEFVAMTEKCKRLDKDSKHSLKDALRLLFANKLPIFFIFVAFRFCCF